MSINSKARRGQGHSRRPAVTSILVVVMACLGFASAAVAADAPKVVIDTQGFTAMVNWLDFSPGGDLIAAAGTDKVVRIWETDTGRLSFTLRGHDGKAAEGFCMAVAFSPDGRKLLVGVQDYTDEGAIRVYDLKNLGEIEALLPGHASGGVNRLAFSGDGKYLVSLGADGEVVFWDWPARRRIGEGRVQGSVTYIGFPTGLPILAAYDAAGFHAWSAPRAKDLAQLAPAEWAELGPPAEVQTAIDSARGFGQALGSVTLPYEGRLNSNRPYPERGLALMAGRGRKEGRDAYWVGLWSTRDGRRLQLYEGQRFTPSALALTADGTLAASADVLGEVHLWDASTGRIRHKFTAEGRPVYKVGFASSGEKLGFGVTPLGPGRWGFNSYGDLDHTFDLVTRQFNPSAPGDHLVEATRLGRRSLELVQQGGQYAIKSALDGRPESRYPFPPGLHPMCYSLLRSDRLGFEGPAVFGLNNNALVIHDPRNMLLRRELVGHQGAVNAVGESPDGRLLVSGSDDRTIRFWGLGGLKQDAWPDFDTGSDLTVNYLIPGGEAERAGILPGDRYARMDGKELGTLVGDYLAGRWPYRVGQRVRLDLERDGRPYSVTVPLSATGDFAEPLLSLFIADDEWVMWTPQGYYDASPQGDRLIGWHVNQGRSKAAKFFLAEQFRKDFYRPDVINRVLKTGDVEQAIREANAARPRVARELDLRKPGVLEAMEPPVVELIEPSPGERVKSARVTVSGMVRSANDLPVGEVKVLVNGRPVSGKALARRLGDTDRRRAIDREVELFPGENTISVIAANRTATSRPATVKVYSDVARQEKPKTVYLLAVGISEYANPEFSLEFAHRDAEEFARAWKTQAGGLYSKVDSRVLLNKEATAAKVREGMDWLRENVGVDDLAVVFISAHGIDDGEGGFYVASHEVDTRRLLTTTIPNTDLIRLAEGLRCKVMLFLDTCHAGGILGASGSRDDAFRDLVSDQVGAVMYASSTAGGLSQERPAWKHGAFTKAILDTFRDASSYQDGVLSTYDLLPQLDRRVRKLTENAQQPVGKIPPNFGSFSFFQYVDAIKSLSLLAPDAIPAPSPR